MKKTLKTYSNDVNINVMIVCVKKKSSEKKCLVEKKNEKMKVVGLRAEI